MIDPNTRINIGCGAHGLFPRPYAETNARNIRTINQSSLPTDRLVEAIRKRFYAGLPEIDKCLGALGAAGRLKECHELMAIGDVFILAIKDLAKKFRLDFPGDDSMERLVDKLQLVLAENPAKCDDLNLQALEPLLIELKVVCSEAPHCAELEAIYTPFSEALSKPFGSRLILRSVYDPQLKNWGDKQLHSVKFPLRAVLQMVHLLSGLALDSYAYFLKEVQQFPHFETLTPEQMKEVCDCRACLPAIFWERSEMEGWIANEGVALEKQMRRVHNLDLPNGTELQDFCLQLVKYFEDFEARFNYIPNSFAYAKDCPIPDYLSRMERLYQIAHFLVAERFYTVIHGLSNLASQKSAVFVEGLSFADVLRDFRHLSRYKVIQPAAAPLKKKKKVRPVEGPHARLLGMAARIQNLLQSESEKKGSLQNALYQLDLLTHLTSRESLGQEAYVEACSRSAWTLEQAIKTKMERPSRIHNLRVLWQRAALGAIPDAVETFYLANHWVRFPFEEVELRVSQSTATGSETKLPKVLKQLHRVAKGENIPDVEQKIARLVNQTLDALTKLFPKPKKKVPAYAIQQAEHRLISFEAPRFESLREALQKLLQNQRVDSAQFRQALWHLSLLESAMEPLPSAKDAADSGAYCLRALEETQHFLSELLCGLLSLSGKPVPTIHECGELAQLLGVESKWFDEALKGVSTKARYPAEEPSLSVAGKLIDKISAYRLRIGERAQFAPEEDIPKVMTLIRAALEKSQSLLTERGKGV